ncbi:efflux RND transporter permease subunit [Rhodopirellula sallentina]|uniref:Multidrug efflux pump, RND family, AcrB/AcrD/AcrF subfamily protein n=1 Tax=Rhodopirellula sallentina SM41 TaxID=1263870 RepID=M5UD94_9BACT|nr:efflux RND transporter permease subunit [Rhodopirellula sallentina]EMI53983.1 multidrug efflux pump, RND family, AcrB/AcrD/AcrF subfamily protein [Rhodopirellula sallentina SM41]
MGLPAAAAKYRTIVVSLSLMAMLWGTITFFTMPRREDPQFTIRVCVVSTSWPGAPAETVEELITDKIEQTLISIEEVDFTRSTTLTGQSTIFVELEDNVPPSDIQNVWDKVRARVDLVPMPAADIRPVVNDEFGDTSVLLLAVHQTPSHDREKIREQDAYSDRQLEIYAEDIQDALRLLPGVAKVEMFGERDEAIYIETDLANWAQLQLTTTQLQALATQRNIIQAGGELDTESGHYSVKTEGEFNAVQEIEQIASTVRTGRGDNSVPLKQLGLKVTRGVEDPADYLCRFGDESGATPAVMLGITMKSGANIIDVCTTAKRRVDEMMHVEKRLPPDIGVTAVSDQSTSVEKKITDVIVNVVEAVLIVVVVVYVVVGFRTSFVMAANIPIVVIVSIGLISLFGVELEQISLAALIISLGLLVDNAVQVCDQARSNQMAGMKPFPAAIEGANTLAVPMLVGTLTTMAAFVPMLFSLEGGGKEYVYSLPVTVSTTLGLSWLLAMTLCVILAGFFIRAPKSDRSGSPIIAAYETVTGWFPRLRKRKASIASAGRESLPHRVYNVIGGWAVTHYWITILLTIVMVVGILMLPVSSEFFPNAAGTQFAVKVILPETATIEQTSRAAEEVENIIRRLSQEQPEGKGWLRSYRTLVGGGGSRWHLSWSPEPKNRAFAEILVRTTDTSVTPLYVQRVREVAERGDASLGISPVIGARVVPVQLALGPPADPLVFRILGSGFADPDVLRTAADRLKQIVAAQPETWDVSDSWGIDGYQIRVAVDPDRATLAGVTNSQVAKTLNSYYSGLQLTTFREGDHQVPVYFRLEQKQRESINGLQESFVEGDNGKVPLASIATLEPTFELAKIGRRNMNRTIEVSSRMEPGVTGNDVVSRVLKSDEMEALKASLPVGYWIEPGGSYEESVESGGQMMKSFAISFVLIILCLLFQYNGWLRPLIILSTLPIALVGAWLGLYLFDESLGFMPQLGILALFGIVLNTAIIFIEFADILVAERLAAKRAADPQSTKQDGSEKGGTYRLSNNELRECLVEAGKQRMLPIFLTTATTVGGLIPLALSGGPLWEGLAYCMIVGLSLTTVLTLVIIPALYAATRR